MLNVDYRQIKTDNSSTLKMQKSLLRALLSVSLVISSLIRTWASK